MTGSECQRRLDEQQAFYLRLLREKDQIIFDQCQRLDGIGSERVVVERDAWLRLCDAASALYEWVNTPRCEALHEAEQRGIKMADALRPDDWDEVS